MKRYYGLALLFLYACKTHPDANGKYDPTQVYKLRLAPVIGAQYHYDISNESELHLEVQDKPVDNDNKSTVGLSYLIDRDSAGNFVLKTIYEKIHFHSKNGDTETDLDTEHTGESKDPVEELLGILKNDTLTVVVSPIGEIRSIRGYEQMKARLLNKISAGGNAYLRSTAEKQFDQRIRERLVKNTMQQFLNIFPDSAVHVGDRWKITSTQQDQLKMHIITSYQLTEIRDQVAVISAHGDITGDSSPGNIDGYDYTADLKGQQEGKFEIEMSTGMLLNGHMTSDIEGQLSMMARQIPVSLHTSLGMEGKKLR